MLPALNVANATPPEVPSAQPGAAADGGEPDAFAHVLQRAQGEAGPAPEGTCGKAPLPNAHRGDAPPRGAPRSEHKLPAAGEPAVDAVAGDGGDRGIERAHDGNAMGLPIAADGTAAEQHEPAAIEAAAATPSVMPEAIGCMPQQRAEAVNVTMPVTQAPNEDTLANGRISLRLGARDIRLPQRGESGATALADATAAHDVSRGLAVAQAQTTQERAALEAVAGQGARVTPASIERLPLDAINPAAAAMHGAREPAPQAVARADAATATLRAPIDHAGFAPALGAQVALWVRDGVQEARLQLHPAELGPVTVQIALDGNAAHVDFTAAVAATRDSIEQSLPALAAALRESGFTLAGGGVFGRSGQGASEHDSRQRTPAGRGARMAAIGGSADAATAAAPRRWARSLLDVYA